MTVAAHSVKIAADGLGSMVSDFIMSSSDTHCLFHRHCEERALRNTNPWPAPYVRPLSEETRSSADADNGLDAFVGQSRSTNILGPFQVK